MTADEARSAISSLDEGSAARECLLLFATIPHAIIAPSFPRIAAHAFGPAVARTLGSDATDEDAERMLDPLLTRGLLTSAGFSYAAWRIEPQAAAVVTAALTPDAQRQWAERAVRAADRYGRSEESGNDELALDCAELIKQWELDGLEAGMPLLRAGAALRRRRSDAKEASIYVRRALEIFERHLGANHLDVAEACYRLAELTKPDSDESPSTVDLFSRALRIRLAALPPRDPLVLDTVFELAEAHLERGELSAAARALQPVETAVPDMLTIDLATHRAKVDASTFDAALRARYLHNRAGLAHRAGDHELALSMADVALHLRLGLEKRDQADSLLAGTLGSSYELMSDILFALERFADGGRYTALRLASSFEAIGVEPGERLKWIAAYPSTDGVEARMHAEGLLAFYQEALVIGEALVGSNDPALLPVLQKLAPLLTVMNGYRSAEPTYKQMLALAEHRTPHDLAMALLLSAKALAHERRFEDAEPQLVRARAVIEASPGSNGASTMEILDTSVRVLERLGRHSEAAPIDARASALAVGNPNIERVAARERRDRWNMVRTLVPLVLRLVAILALLGGFLYVMLAL
jgi:tetratricopeptide (TPR) repeat protein